MTLFLVALVGCSKASEEDCDRAYEQLIELRTSNQPTEVKQIKRAQMDRDRPEFLERCVGKVKPEVIHCWLKSSTEEQLEKCD